MSIQRNRAKCLECGKIVESKHRHDFQSCECGQLSVDGGKDYLRRVHEGPWKELSEVLDDDGLPGPPSEARRR